jgi:hypothetical protein
VGRREVEARRARPLCRCRGLLAGLQDGGVGVGGQHGQAVGRKERQKHWTSSTVWKIAFSRDGDCLETNVGQLDLGTTLATCPAPITKPLFPLLLKASWINVAVWTFPGYPMRIVACVMTCMDHVWSLAKRLGLFRSSRLGNTAHPCVYVNIG